MLAIYVFQFNFEAGGSHLDVVVGVSTAAMRKPKTKTEFCRKHNIRTEDEAWGLAGDLEEQGDKALSAFLMENDVNVMLQWAVRAMIAKANLEREKMSRIEILKAHLINEKGNIDGPFQKDVIPTRIAE